MICDKGIEMKFVVLLLLGVVVWGDEGVRCTDREREALVSFKNGLTDESGILSSWRTDECCNWYGVVCSNTTDDGHVISLELGAGNFYVGLVGKVSSSLLELHHLNYLDLSYNDFGGDRIPEFIGSMKQLRYLYLRASNFSGIVPPELGNLTNLVQIDLSKNALGGVVPKYFGNLSHLQALVMYDNHLRGGLDELIGNLSAKGFLQSSLQILDLAYNEFDGPIPDLSVFSALTQVYLGQNNLTGSLPLSLGHLSKLHILEVSSNHLEGVVSESHFTKLDRLEILDLSFNSLSLEIAQDWNPHFLLTELYLTGCNMGPSFPKWIQNQKNLTCLDLSSVGIIDEVPMWLWSFSPSLEFLSLSDNQISGTIPDLSSILIKRIDLSSNKISGSIPLFHPNTRSFQLSRNMFSGSISSSICKLPHAELMFLDLSNNHLSGELPNCFKKMPKLSHLNLANNSFSGKMPHSLPDQLSTLRLNHNNLSGELPSTLRFCQELLLIDVGRNKLNGEIPPWIGAIYEMQFLNLRSNEFYGGIPPEICNLTSIRVLDISRNKLSGRIPNCFNNLATLAEKDATHAYNKFGFLIYDIYDPHLLNTKTIKLYDEYSSFQWKGQELEYRRNLVLLTLIDISSNRLSGTIPHSFSNLRGLISLNLSRNNLTGNIIPNIGQMEMLECLDLSHNQLSGQIPMSLAQLHFLDILDLSDNNLSGKIPSSTQLQSFNTSSYDGNDGLCGKPLELCPEDSPRPPTPTQGEEDDGLIWSLSFMQGLCISIGFGFIVGFWGAVGSLVLKKSWRYAYFKLLDDVGDGFYVKISIFLSKWRPS